MRKEEIGVNLSDLWLFSLDEEELKEIGRLLVDLGVNEKGERKLMT